MSKYSFDIPQESEVMKEFLKIAAEENIYNVDTGEDENGKELVEKAHPEKDEVDVTDTYMIDTGLVENITQQQETDMEVALKMPDNKVSRKTMAETNLEEELMLIADEMSVRGEVDLELFAKKINKNLTKEALLPPLAIAGIVAIPAILSAYLYAVHVSDPNDFGVETNLDSLNWAIEEYKATTVEGFAPESGSNITLILERLQSLVTKIGNARMKYLTAVAHYSDIITNIPKSRSDMSNIDPDVVKNNMQDPREAKAIQLINGLTNKYNSDIKSVIPYLTKTYSYLKEYFETSENLVSDETGERSTWSQVWEKTKEVGGYFEKSNERHLLDAFGVAINSLKHDLLSRKKETNQIISTLKNPIEDKISLEDYDIKEIDVETEKETTT